jgi:hypothetical protein
MRLYYVLFCGLLLVMLAIRCWQIPLAHDEVATFYFYIQPGEFFPFLSHVDANNHFLTSALGWLCFKLFGSSPFSLRLPSLLSFCLLCYAVWRFRELLVSRVAWLILAFSFLLVYHFDCYFGLCRGYGISMAALVAGLFYLFSCLNECRERHILKFLLLMQIALSANLTLIFVALGGLAVIVLLQLWRRLPFSARLLWAYSMYVLLLAFWISYAFYLKENGALYYGAGESYYRVTFRSLIQNLFGHYLFVEVLLVGLAVIVMAAAVLFYVKRKRWGTQAGLLLAAAVLAGLIVLFFFLKQFLGVNYPEDRTGLFFYVIFVCAIAFFADAARPYARTALLVLMILASAMSWRAFSLRIQPWGFYETIPAGFHSKLVQEQERSGSAITIGGHRIREFIYGFLNYRSPKKLSHCTSPEALQMNCDYALGVVADRPWYNPYYRELMRGDDQNLVLLKRRSPITRKRIVTSGYPAFIEDSEEFHNFAELSDTTFGDTNPLQATISLEVEECPVPFRGYLVFQVQAEGDTGSFLLRTPLELVRYDWNRSERTTLTLVTGPMPRRVKRLVVYLWNEKKAFIQAKIHSFALDRLEAPGINVISKALI